MLALRATFVLCPTSLHGNPRNFYRIARRRVARPDTPRKCFGVNRRDDLEERFGERRNERHGDRLSSSRDSAPSPLSKSPSALRKSSRGYPLY